MTMQDYRSTVSARIPAADAFNKIVDVSQWWSKRTTGRTRKVGDKFKVDWGETWLDFEVVEAVPHRRIAWQVTECQLPWLKDKKEWKDTKVVWDLAIADGATNVTMTHVGLTPAVECFGSCEAGWNFYFGKSLLRLFTEGSGLPDQMSTAEA